MSARRWFCCGGRGESVDDARFRERAYVNAREDLLEEVVDGAGVAHVHGEHSLCVR